MIGWRAGSTATSEQTSVSREARRSLTSLWRTVGNPPVGQFRAWLVLKGSHARVNYICATFLVYSSDTTPLFVLYYC